MLPYRNLLQQNLRLKLNYLKPHELARKLKTLEESPKLLRFSKIILIKQFFVGKKGGGV